MFSELVLLGILCILAELKNNLFFKRRKDEEDSICVGDSFVLVR